MNDDLIFACGGQSMILTQAENDQPRRFRPGKTPVSKWFNRTPKDEYKQNLQNMVQFYRGDLTWDGEKFS